MDSTVRSICRNAALLLLVVLYVAIGTCLDSRADQIRGSGNSPGKSWLMISLNPDGHSRGGKNVQSVIENISGEKKCVSLHFRDVTLELLEELAPAFIVLSPQGTPWCRYTGKTGVALQNFLWMIPTIAEDLNIPILGICGGHQALALAFGGRVGPIRAGSLDCMPYNKERQGGVIKLTQENPDPIFVGLEGKVNMVESHYDEVKTLPPGFILLASDKLSPYQIIRHPNRPVYGIQGHPEHFLSSRPDGGILIRNFLKIAETHNETARRTFKGGQESLAYLR